MAKLSLIRTSLEWLSKSFVWIIDYVFGYTSEKLVERNEKLFQTYLIVFGLLISCNFKDQLKEQLMMSFMFFIWAGLCYYVALSRFYKRIQRIGFNTLALLIGINFSYGIVSCIFAFSPKYHEINPLSSELIMSFLALAILVSTSLFV